MPKVEHPPTEGAAWPSLAVGLAVLVAPTSAIALAHILDTAAQGMICGAATTAGAAHCWACYAAPMLALAAVASWRRASLARSPARVRAR